MSEDIRAVALLDHLNEIDVREAEVRNDRRSWWMRALNLAIVAVPLVLLERLGINILIPALLVVPIPLSWEFLVRAFRLWRLDRERGRLLALYDEIDRAAERVTR